MDDIELLAQAAYNKAKTSSQQISHLAEDMVTPLSSGAAGDFNDYLIVQNSITGVTEKVTVANLYNMLKSQMAFDFLAANPSLALNYIPPLGMPTGIITNGLAMSLDGSTFPASSAAAWSDSSGQSNAANIYGFGYTTASGKNGYGGVTFDGVDDYVVSPVALNTATV
jgi:hypothetical protein